MSQTLLFAIGVGVFAMTVCATLLYGYLMFNQIYEAAVAADTTTVVPPPERPETPADVVSLAFPVAVPVPVPATDS